MNQPPSENVADPPLPCGGGQGGGVILAYLIYFRKRASMSRVTSTMPFSLI